MQGLRCTHPENLSISVLLKVSFVLAYLVGQYVGRDAMKDQAEKYGAGHHQGHKLGPRQIIVQYDDGKNDTGQATWPEPAEKQSASHRLAAARQARERPEPSGQPSG